MRPLVDCSFAGFECDREPAGLCSARGSNTYVKYNLPFDVICLRSGALRSGSAPLKLQDDDLKKKLGKAKRRLPLIWSRPQPPIDSLERFVVYSAAFPS